MNFMIQKKNKTTHLRNNFAFQLAKHVSEVLKLFNTSDSLIPIPKRIKSLNFI